jgi:hypothetical protein
MLHRTKFAAQAVFFLSVAVGPASSLIAPLPGSTAVATRSMMLDAKRKTAAASIGVHNNKESQLSSLSATRLFNTPLPKDISPFDKSASKGRDVQGELRKLATVALENALSSNKDSSEIPTLLELEFPPLIGGEQSKTQFDDFDSKYVELSCDVL